MSIGKSSLPSKELLRALRLLDKRGGTLARETVEAYERARRELLGRILAGTDTALTVVRYHAILAQVDDRLALLYRDVTSRFGAVLGETARLEANQAIKELRAEVARLPVPPISLAMEPVVPHAMVQNLIENSAQLIKSVNEDLLGRIRVQLTQAMIRGEGSQKAARAILGEGLTLDGIQPVFPTALRRAQTIARTELSNAANQAHLATYLEAKKTLPDLRVEWVSVLCSTTCGRCQDMNGTTREPGEAFAYGNVAPPQHPRCLCRLVSCF